MNSPAKPPTSNHPRGQPKEFEQIIHEKSHNFVGRDFVFTAIDEFIHRYNRGYFTIIGAPGSGKSAILAQYAIDHPHVVYYNAELEGKNSVDEFLRVVCQQLSHWLDSLRTPPQPFPQARREQEVEFLSLSVVLQEISDQLDANQKLIIAIDGLNCIDRNSQPPGTNLFYLPRYLPDGVYFLLSRRPFLRERSGLLIEAPSQCLDLADYPEENGRDVQAYIQGNLTPLTPLPYEGMGGQDDENDPRLVFPDAGMGGQENYSPLLAGEELGEGSNLKSWLSNHHITEGEFCDRLTTSSENNFMYLTQIMGAITDNLDSEPFEYNQLPPALAAYYQQHLQNMLPPAQQQELSRAILNILATQQQPISAEAIADILDIDEFAVEEILENWLEFLQLRKTGDEYQYQLYHSRFRDWIIQIWS